MMERGERANQKRFFSVRRCDGDMGWRRNCLRSGAMYGIGKEHLEANLFADLELVGSTTDGKDSPLFRTMDRRGGYSETPINGGDICSMVKR
jgi:hypothetical protein